MKELKAVLQDWEAVIGLEVHTELTTLNTKMFCSCPIEFGAKPNTQVCPICLGLPGALPVPNKAAIESIVLAGLATNCEIMKQSMFYRKNYVYADMTKNFQTTQGPIAFCMNGSLNIEITGTAALERIDQDQDCQDDGYIAHIGITRIHMEEDTGKLVHVGGVDGRITGASHSLIDYNRCGLPLIELVTEPDLRTPEEARAFVQKLRQIYLTLGISDCSMEEGSLRCDGNISLRRRGAKAFGTKTELKNMNSFKNLHDGLAYEICRQAEVLENGGVVLQETRHWEPATKRTTSMRVKETADDYRYFPEPDLAPFNLSDEFIESIRARLPELPDEKRARFVASYEIAGLDAANLANDVEAARFFDNAMQCVTDSHTQDSALDVAKEQATSLAGNSQQDVIKLAKIVVNLQLNEVQAYLNANNLRYASVKFAPEHIAALAQLVYAETISSKQAKEVFAVMVQTGQTPQEIVTQKGMKQVSDVLVIREQATLVLQANADKVKLYLDGKTGLIGFFVGQVMQKTSGQANPKLVNDVLIELLDKASLA